MEVVVEQVVVEEEVVEQVEMVETKSHPLTCSVLLWPAGAGRHDMQHRATLCCAAVGPLAAAAAGGGGGGAAPAGRPRYCSAGDLKIIIIIIIVHGGGARVLAFYSCKDKDKRGKTFCLSILDSLAVSLAIFLSFCVCVSPRRANVLAGLTSVAQREAPRLVGAIRVEVDDGKVPADLDLRPLALAQWRWAAPVEARHHLATGGAGAAAAAVQQLHHVRLVGQVEKGEAEEQGGGAGDLHCPVAGPARSVAVREVWRVEHP